MPVKCYWIGHGKIRNLAETIKEYSMRLPSAWEPLLSRHLVLNEFYWNLDEFVASYKQILPREDLIFKVFTYMQPAEVSCILFGEDPYPRLSSANGVAFWDAEIQSWQDRTHGNAMKNILKALLVARGLADYSTPIARCREIASGEGWKAPGQLFQFWLKQGILLINTSMTFSSAQDKREHFRFWRPFHKALIKTVNQQVSSPFYILWGKKAWRWESEILPTVDDPSKIIKQGHPTFIHQFLDRNHPNWSPFTEIRQRTGMEW